MIDDDRAALACAQDFSSGIAVWRAANAPKRISDFATGPTFRQRAMLPLTVAAILTLMDCVLLGFALLPASVSL